MTFWARADAAAKDKNGDAWQLLNPLRPTAAGRFYRCDGFEVRSDAFVDDAQADGDKIDGSPTDMGKAFGLKIAFITDPNGTRIELTQGLSAK